MASNYLLLPSSLVSLRGGAGLISSCANVFTRPTQAAPGRGLFPCEHRLFISMPYIRWIVVTCDLRGVQGAVAAVAILTRPTLGAPRRALFPGGDGETQCSKFRSDEVQDGASLRSQAAIAHCVLPLAEQGRRSALPPFLVCAFGEQGRATALTPFVPNTGSCHVDDLTPAAPSVSACC
jgi:hypothetical protein